MSERFVNPPIKRHPTLQPLSREHFNGLTLVRRLREAASGDEAARGSTRGLLATAWRGELCAHFADEEKLIAPFVCDRDRARLIEDHRSLQRRIEMAIDADSAPSAAWLHETAEMLERHIRWEERELFPAAETNGAVALDSLSPEAERIQRDRPGSPRRNDESPAAEG